MLGRCVVCIIWLPALVLAARAGCQTPAGAAASLPGARAGSSPELVAASGLLGLPVRRIGFEGVAAEKLAPLPEPLGALLGAPLTSERLARGLRAVYASGLFETVAAEAVREQDGVALIFRGAPRTFVGTVSVYGARGATMNTQLERASRLSAGNRFTEARLDEARLSMRQALADNGFEEPRITETLTRHPADQLVDIAFRVDSGPETRIGAVVLSGDSGMTVDAFRREARLRAGALVDHDTVNRALNGVVRYYRRQGRLEAEIKLESADYDPTTKRTRYRFIANRGPLVRVRVQGASIGTERMRHAIPVYEEGTVDEDLLNEGSRRLRDYYQRLGYFDVKVSHQRQTPSSNEVALVYSVDLGSRRHVEKVTLSGNRYFDAATLRDLLSVHPANALDRHGTYSQALVAADVSALEAVYQNNGFSKVKVTPTTNLVESVDAETDSALHPPARSPGLVIDYHIDEGEQQRVGRVAIEGNDHTETNRLLALLNTATGQLFSPQNLGGDRDAILTDYLGRGFDQVAVEVDPEPEPGSPNVMDVAFRIHEGQQIFVRNVLLTGLHFTRPATVARAITLRNGDPLSQTSLLETQRNLYNYALFSEVNTAIENPAGGASQKTVLLELSEARRWSLTYGLGFEAQTGTPQNNCAGYLATGTAACSPNGKTGISPRGIAAITRNNLFGREQSASIQGTYGLLEQKVALVFENPHFLGHPDFAMNVTGGYANSQDVTTYVASKFDAGLRFTEHFNASYLSRADTLVYEFDFRRVKVAASSLQVYPAEIPALAAAVRVSGPGITWIRDTRDSPLDAHRGTYTSFQDFVSARQFGAEAEFNRLDLSNSSFYGFDKNRVVLARNSRYAQERAFGDRPGAELIPLPERVYAGGPTSLRGFSVNAAGPRDPETGFPIGGAGALVNSTELRLPPPPLPWFGDSVSLVLFHDMGNVFTNAGDAWASVLRVRQPDRDACRIVGEANPPSAPAPSGSVTSTGQQDQCSFNYFSHAAGLGVRYHTPVGPIRLDFSYNLNPPIFPVNVDYSLSQPYSAPHVGEASHFNFFFSLGQTF